jgi:hypothetical protein
MVSMTRGFSVSRTGEAERVGGREIMSMSIIIEDLRRRKAGSNGKSGRGTGAAVLEILGSRTTVDGRANDQDRTRSKAKT